MIDETSVTMRPRVIEGVINGEAFGTHVTT
jgi:hypothetical protein